MTPISATPGTEVQATFEPDLEELDDEEDLSEDPPDPPESDDEDDPFDEPEDDDESLDDEDAPAFSVFLSPEPEPGSEPDLPSEDADELASELISDLSLVLPLRESVR
jgi:hypothetical protein